MKFFILFVFLYFMPLKNLQAQGNESLKKELTTLKADLKQMQIKESIMRNHAVANLHITEIALNILQALEQDALCNRRMNYYLKEIDHPIFEEIYNFYKTSCNTQDFVQRQNKLELKIAMTCDSVGLINFIFDFD